jgi:acid phosphatase
MVTRMQSKEPGGRDPARPTSLCWRLALVLAAGALSLMLAEARPTPAAQVLLTGTPGPFPIQNIIVIMMENQAFDTLFGTYYQVNPAVNGLQVFTPQPGGTPTPLPQINLSATPYATLPVPTVYAAQFPNPVPNGPVLLGSATGAGPLSWAQTLSAVPTHLYYANQYQIHRNPATGHAPNDQFVIWDSIEYSTAPPTPQTNAGALVMGYWNLNGSNLWNWARSYTLADNYFQAAFGGSWLNHMFLVCACTGQFAPTPAPPIAQAVPVPGLPPGFFLDANSNVRATDSFVVDTSMPPFAFLPPGYPPEGPTVPPLTSVAYGGFTTPTVVPARHIGNRLDDRNLSWAFYGEGYALTVTPGPTSTPGGRTDADHLPFNQFPNPAATPGQQKIQDLNNLRQALVTGTNVPAVAIIMPAKVNSMHPGEGSLQAGDAWLGPVPTPGVPTPVGTVGLLTAIRNSPIWPNTAVIVTWDENGGFYDHVSPPIGDQWGPGSRVPALIISPYSTGGVIDKNQYDHTSILKLIEAVFDVPPLGGERANMGNLLTAFQFPPATATAAATATRTPTSTATSTRTPTATPTATPAASATPVPLVILAGAPPPLVLPPLPFLPPPSLPFLLPPPPPFLPPPSALPPGAAAAPPSAPPAAPPQAAIPLIPELDTASLLVGGLVALASLGWLRKRRR